MNKESVVIGAISGVLSSLAVCVLVVGPEWQARSFSDFPASGATPNPCTKIWLEERDVDGHLTRLRAHPGGAQCVVEFDLDAGVSVHPEDATIR